MELLKRARAGDKQAVSRLVEENLGLVWSVVRKFSGRGHDMEDLYQLGCIGLLKAVEKFDFSYDVRFSTYAVPMIMGEIKRFLRDDGVIKVSRSLKETAARARVAADALEKELMREPTVGEIAGRLGMESEELVMALDAVAAPESLYKTIHEGERAPIFLMDRLARREDAEGDTVDKIALGEAFRALDLREKKIIEMRYFKGNTQSEVAKELGISQVQVSRLEKKILMRIRQDMQEAL